MANALHHLAHHEYLGSNPCVMKPFLGSERPQQDGMATE